MLYDDVTLGDIFQMKVMDAEGCVVESREVEASKPPAKRVVKLKDVRWQLTEQGRIGPKAAKK